VRSATEHALAALHLLARAEGELRAAAVGDFGVPAMLAAAPELTAVVREKVAAVFGLRPPPVVIPGDAR
jgi:hypothetical protein